MSAEKLRQLFTRAKELGLGVLTEAHNEREVEDALKAGCDVVGINNRDLSTFTVDHSLARRMSEMIPANVVVVAESGVKTVEDVMRVGESGMDAVLVGETLMRSDDIAATVHTFANQKKAVRR
jgi:indole-3-glycerol phosphate synthase